MGLTMKFIRLFGLCYAMDEGYKGWNPYRERHLAIFVNCF
ncbi:atn1 domain protein [Microcystis aeruginosa FACHB-905 = DIANCHI905]|nr:atn1 domain protein [Microcystis aeruginosa FACHB-905 = DIANCHI905]